MASMNDCKTVQPRLGEYVDGTLEPNAAWHTGLHLASCAVCARIASDLEAATRLLQNLPREEPSPNFEAALAARLADQALRTRRTSLAGRIREWWSLPRVRPALAMAGALAVVLPVVFMATPARRSTRPGGTPAADLAFVEQCLDEHASFAAAEPLGDQAAVLLATQRPAVREIRPAGGP